MVGVATKKKRKPKVTPMAALLEIKLHSQVWLFNCVGVLNGPYFVLRVSGDDVVIARHYVSEGMGGSKYSQFCIPIRISKEYCVLLNEQPPKIYGAGDLQWFLTEYGEVTLRHCRPLPGLNNVKQVSCGLS